MELTGYQRVLEVLERSDLRHTGSNWQCPAHEDRKPSMTLKEGREGRALLTCHTGCSLEDIVRALGLDMADLFTEGSGKFEIVATYTYTDEQGEPLFEVVRCSPKDFRQRRPDGTWKLNGVRRVPYRLPQVLEAIEAGKPAYIAEGEKDVHALEKAGAVATCNPGGAENWRSEFSSYFTDADVVVVADRDEVGRRHAQQVVSSVAPVVRSLQVVEAATGKDASDHLGAGRGLEEFSIIDASTETRDDEDGPSVALDVALMKSEAEKAPPKLVVDGFLKLKDIIGLAGEEGDGKTMLADQFCRELIRGEPLVGMFEPGEFAPERILFVDTHQEQEEWEARTLDMSERGLDVEPGRYFWWHPDGGLILSTNEGDRTQLEAQIEWTGATFVWFDAASHLVEEAKDDSDVKKLFEYLSGLQRRHDLVGIGMTLFNRKRAAGDYTRRFDDLFGSREWKGRLSRAVYIEANKITCWKDRGSLLRACWPHRVGGGRYPQARLERPGFDDPASVPFSIDVSEAPPDAVEVEDIEAKVIDVLTATPDAYTKTSLAGRVGGRAEDVRQVINQMLADGKIGPNRRGSKLHVEGDATPMTLIENEE